MTQVKIDFVLSPGEAVVAKFMTAFEEKEGWGRIFKDSLLSTPLLGEPYVVTNKRLIVLGKRSYKIVEHFPLGGLGIRTDNVRVKDTRQIGDVMFFKDGKRVITFTGVVGPRQVVDLVMSIQNQQWAASNKKISP